MKNFKTLVLMSAITAFYGCSSTPERNSAVDEASANFRVAQADPSVQKYAAIELKDAGDALARAEAAFKEEAKPADVEHLAYLAKQKTAIAVARANNKSYQEAIAQSTSEREKILLQARSNEIDKLRSELNAKQTDRGLTISLGDVLFDTGKAELKSGGAREIGKLAQFLRDNPQRNVSIEGFTDSQGSDEYNQSLSERRAAAVKNELANSGVAADRIISHGYGESYPVADNTTSAGRQMNRRVEIIIADEGKQITPR